MPALPFQNTHVPLEVPDEWLNKTKQAHPEWGKTKQLYQSMVTFLDDGVKNVTDALRSKGYFDNTLVIFRCASSACCPPPAPK